MTDEMTVDEYRELLKKRTSEPEEEFAGQCKMNQLPEPIRQYKFHPYREWRADFAFPDRLLLIEIEGGVFANGRHTRGAGYEKDIEKYNAAVLLGYRLLRFSPGMVTSGEAITTVQEALKEAT